MSSDARRLRGRDGSRGVHEGVSRSRVRIPERPGGGRGRTIYCVGSSRQGVRGGVLTHLLFLQCCVALPIGAYSTLPAGIGTVSCFLAGARASPGWDYGSNWWKLHGQGGAVGESPPVYDSREPEPVRPPPRAAWGSWAAAVHVRVAAAGRSSWELAARVGNCGAWFSSSDHPGALCTGGGWVLNSIDALGLWAFGNWWPAVGRIQFHGLHASPPVLAEL